MSDPRINKRWLRSLRPRPARSAHQGVGPQGQAIDTGAGGVRIVYRPKSPEEGQRRVDRALAIKGAPFVRMPGGLPDSHVLFDLAGLHRVTVADVEMVFNDCLLMDAISNYGEDGPLYKDTLDGRPMREVYTYALKVYAGVELPAAYRMPPPIEAA